MLFDQVLRVATGNISRYRERSDFIVDVRQRGQLEGLLTCQFSKSGELSSACPSLPSPG
jgi:hypothetical protein